MTKWLITVLVLIMTGCNGGSSSNEEQSTLPVVPVITPNEKSSAELVITNGIIYRNEAAQAIAVKAGVISFIGTNAEVEKLIGDNTQTVNANGQLVLPGFIDNHNHLVEGGEMTCFPNRESTLAEQTTLLANCAKNAVPGTWITGYGGAFELEMQAASVTTLSTLDSLFPNNPVIIMDWASHAQFVNSLAYEKAGINKESAAPQGGVYLKNEDGDLNGILMDNAGDMVMEIAVNSMAARLDSALMGIDNGLKEAKRNGITTVGDGRTYWRQGIFEAWQQVAKENKLTARISIRPWIYPEVEKAEQLEFLAKAFQNDINELLIVNQVKMYSDGMPEYSTARVIEPYEFAWFEGYPNGVNYLTQEVMSNWLVDLFAMGYGAHIHAIGDLGVREALNAIESVRDAGSALNYNMTHLQLIDPSDIPRFAALGVDADFQMVGASFNEDELAQYIAPYIGQIRAKELHHTPVKELYNSGANVVLSSDWTVNPISPMSAISYSVEGGALTIEQAIDAYTIKPALALGLETITGTIEVGKSADFAILSTDITKATSEQIRNSKVVTTILQGKVVYQK
jgi:predicted amidohydrolase YtcJ